MTDHTNVARLPWERDLEATKRKQPAFIAWPEGAGTAPYARIDYSYQRQKHEAWHWWIYWPGRFEGHGTADTKQGAADAATTAYHRQIAETPDWSLPVEPLIPPIIATITAMSDEELAEASERYLRARAYGYVPCIETDERRDQMVYSALVKEWERRRDRL